MLIQNYGLFWNERGVFWGAGSKAGRLLGAPASNITAEPTDFREQSGVYVLYADYDVVYVGQAGSGNQKLFTRLKQHTRDPLPAAGINSLGSESDGSSRTTSFRWKLMASTQHMARS